MLSTKVREKSVGKTKQMHLLAVLLVPAVALIMGASALQVWAQGEFDDADVYAELNDTDNDLGFHALIDGEGWKYLEIEDPTERKMLNLIVRGRLRRQGLTELFFESAEPPFDELTPAQFFHRFPAGMYEIEAKTLDGMELENEDLFRHVMPAAPGGIMVNDAGPINHKTVDCEEGPIPEVELEEGEDIIISWDQVDSSHPTVGIEGEIEVERYQGVLEFETPDEIELTYTVDLPDGVTEMTIPYSFIALGLVDGEGEFKFEILVKEALGGNQTAAESCFAVISPE